MNLEFLRNWSTEDLNELLRLFEKEIDKQRVAATQEVDAMNKEKVLEKFRADFGENEACAEALSRAEAALEDFSEGVPDGLVAALGDMLSKAADLANTKAALTAKEEAEKLAKEQADKELSELEKFKKQTASEIEELRKQNQKLVLAKQIAEVSAEIESLGASNCLLEASVEYLKGYAGIPACLAPVKFEKDGKTVETSVIGLMISSAETATDKEALAAMQAPQGTTEPVPPRPEDKVTNDIKARVAVFKRSRQNQGQHGEALNKAVADFERREMAAAGLTSGEEV